MNRIDAILRWTVGPDVLDIGCAGETQEEVPGSKYWLHGRIRKVFPNTLGLDVSESAVKRLESAGFDGILVGDAQDLDLDRRFDTIVAGGVVHEFEDLGTFLARARDHLKPGGRVVLTDSYPFGLQSFLYALTHYPKTGSHPDRRSWNCPTTIEALGLRHGLRVAHVELVADYRPMPASTWGRVFTVVMETIGRILPRRLRANVFLAVLEVPLSSGVLASKEPDI